jgi:hypothetical protein
MVDPVTADLYEVMEDAWPSGDALRGSRQTTRRCLG